MAEGLFRKKSMDRISSPESLNDYMKVSTPAVWLILLAVIFLLLGVCAWGIWGRLDTKVEIGAVSSDGATVCYVSEDNLQHIQLGMTFSINGVEGSITEISNSPIQYKDLNAYLKHMLSLNDDDWVYEITTDHKLESGIYDADIIIETVSPMSFILN